MTFPIKIAHLVAGGVKPTTADRFIAPLQLAMIEFNITTNDRPAMFLAQIMHESGCFEYTSEIWGPTPAQASYEGRAGLGNTQSGDGYRFRGHGLIQVTGRANHERVSRDFGVPMDAVVLWLTSPIGACRSAAHYWSSTGCNELADAFDFVAVTKRINGGLNGLQERTDKYRRISDSMSLSSR